MWSANCGPSTLTDEFVSGDSLAEVRVFGWQRLRPAVRVHVGTRPLQMPLLLQPNALLEP